MRFDVGHALTHDKQQTTNKQFGTLGSSFIAVGPMDAGFSLFDASRHRTRIDT